MCVLHLQLEEASAVLTVLVAVQPLKWLRSCMSAAKSI